VLGASRLVALDEGSVRLPRARVGEDDTALEIRPACPVGVPDRSRVVVEQEQHLAAAVRQGRPPELADGLLQRQARSANVVGRDEVGLGEDRADLGVEGIKRSEIPRRATTPPASTARGSLCLSSSRMGIGTWPGLASDQSSTCWRQVTSRTHVVS
jgi:hypothetical protein